MFLPMFIPMFITSVHHFPFSFIRCGVLALDEPTTNLDIANIKSLARAISNIVEDQRDKLQLIIITHDTEFLHCLGEDNEYYYEVSKDERGFSQIEQISIREQD